MDKNIKIAVTGGAGFIGSHIVERLNELGYKNIIIIDDFEDANKLLNLKNLNYMFFRHIDDYLSTYNPIILKELLKDVQVIFHQGAISSTTEKNGKKLIYQNMSATQSLLNYAKEHNIVISLASSASVYGNNKETLVNQLKKDKNEDPINPYAMSKLISDNNIRSMISQENSTDKSCFIQSWRYFNVYGERETHKGDMRSMITKFLEDSPCVLFSGSDKIYRDFVYVGDVAKIVVDAAMMLHENKNRNDLIGIFNLGTGKATNVQKIVNKIQEKTNKFFRVIPFPIELHGRYQYFTEANMSNTPLPEGFEFKTPFEYIEEYFQEKE